MFQNFFQECQISTFVTSLNPSLKITGWNLKIIQLKMNIIFHPNFHDFGFQQPFIFQGVYNPNKKMPTANHSNRQPPPRTSWLKTLLPSKEKPAETSLSSIHPNHRGERLKRFVLHKKQKTPIPKQVACICYTHGKTPLLILKVLQCF